MRTAQVNIHVELFGDQVPRGFPEGRRCSFHVYADGFDGVYEAIAAAVAKFSAMYVEAGGTLGRRVDGVSTLSDDPFEQGMARRTEPPRIIDMQDARAIAEYLNERDSAGDA